MERYLRVSFVFFSCFFGGGTFSRDFLCFWFFRVFFLGGRSVGISFFFLVFPFFSWERGAVK